MRTTFGIGFYCRESKANRTGKACIEMGITLNGKRVFLNLPRKEYPEVFRKEMSSKRDNPIKEFCRLMEAKTNEALNTLMRNGIPLTAQTVRSYVQNGGIKSYTLGELFDDYLDYYKKRIGIDLTAGSYRKFELSKELFFQKAKVTPEMEVTALTNAVVLDYYAELRKEYKSASSASYMAKLKTVVKFGMDNNRILVNPFSTVKIKRDKPDIQVLTEEELDVLSKAELQPSLARVRDCFLLQAYSGLSFIDLEHLRPEDIQEKDGTFFIHKKRIKSGVDYTAVIFPEGVEILRKYGFKMPVISNQKSNTYLHAIEGLVGLGKSLHNHLGRHTYAYLLLNKLGVRAETAAKALGHTSPKTTLKFYADITPQTTIKEISKAFARE